MTFFQFIKSKIFFKHLAIYLIVIVFFFWFIFKLLDMYTTHGKTVTVPDFGGLKMSELDNFIKDKPLRYLIVDSLYDTKSPKGTIIRQDPEPNTQVKKDRTIYLYITSILPPQMSMPKLLDKSLRQASSMIESYDLKLGKIQYAPDQCANCILEQRYKGKKIEPGTMIPKGSVIDLLVGKGLGEESVSIPNLIGLTRAEAQALLLSKSLSLGAVSFESPRDSSSSKVYRQIPGYSKDLYINVGSNIDLFFTNDETKISNKDTIIPTEEDFE